MHGVYADKKCKGHINYTIPELVSFKAHVPVHYREKTDSNQYRLQHIFALNVLHNYVILR